MAVYNACIISTLLYGSESWTTYSMQERRLNTFHLRCLRLILDISWQDKVPNTEVLSRANLPSMFTMLRQRRLRWLGHVRRMDDGRIPKDILYEELRSGKRSTGRQQLRFKDVVKRDMKALDIDVRSWEDLAADRPRWRSTLLRQIKSGEEKLVHAAENKRAQRKQRLNPERLETIHRCDSCGKECLSRIGLFSTNVAVRERQNRIQYPMVVCDRRRPTSTTFRTLSYELSMTSTLSHLGL